MSPLPLATGAWSNTRVTRAVVHAYVTEGRESPAMSFFI